MQNCARIAINKSDLVIYMKPLCTLNILQTPASVPTFESGLAGFTRHSTLVTFCVFPKYLVTNALHEVQAPSYECVTFKWVPKKNKILKSQD